jgi:hypothetical protein
MNPQLCKLFEAVSGWLTPQNFGAENEGYVTFETDPKTHRREAFLWKADGSHEHLRATWLAGQSFVRR